MDHTPISQRLTLVGQCILALFLFIVSPCANAQESAEEETKEEFTLETITVESQKREEDIQEVPLSVVGISDVKLEESRIYDLKDLDLIVPNFSFRNFGGRTDAAFLSIRGLATSEASIDPTVGIYIDDIPITDFRSLNSPVIFDLERAEVLRGPQSTLWGVNTEGGAILLYTRDPGEEWSGTVQGEVAMDETFLGRASAGGPLIEDVLSFGLAVSGDTSDGTIENIVDGSSPSESDALGVRSKFIYTPTGELEIRLSLFADTISEENGNTLLPLDRDAFNSFYGSDVDEFEVALDDPGDSELTTNTQSVRIQYETDYFDIVSITSRRDVDQDISFDADQAPIPVDFSAGFGLPAGSFVSNSSAEIDTTLTEYAQEVRLLSPEYSDLPLSWIAGFFYLDRNLEETGAQDFQDAGLIFTFTDSETDGRNIAGFGQATYRLFDERLGLTAGLRYETVRRELDRSDDVAADFSDSKTTSAWLPRFILDYRFTDNFMSYASVARGWRNGGLNQFAADPNFTEYDKETAWTYEMGFKSNFLENRLLLNVAGFYTDVKDYQDTNVLGALAFFSNAERVSIKGVEVELQALPIQGLLLDLSFGLADGEYEEYQFSETQNFDGNTLADVPEWEFTGIAQYSFPFGLYVRGEFFAVGETFFTADNTTRQGAYELYNTRIGFQRDNYDFYVFGENLADKQYFTDSFTFQDGLNFGPVGRGRTIGGGVSLRF